MGVWKPGDVAAVEYFGESPMVAVRVAKCPISSHGAADHWHTERGTWGCRPDKVRPLVVIDPEDREQVTRLVRAYIDQYSDGLIYEPDGKHRKATDDMQSAFRSLVADLKPDGPEEWLAAVLDDEGNRWAIHGGPTDGRVWYSPDLNQYRTYDEITAVRVLSEGVPTPTPDARGGAL